MGKKDPSDSSRRFAGSRLKVLKVAILPVAAHLGLLLTVDLGDHLVATLALLSLAFAGLVVAEKALASKPYCGWMPILVVAALLRLLLLPLPPSLSEDVCRYVWDGRVVRAGLNPYRFAPEADELTGLRDDLWEKLPHRDVPTVYPPLAQGLFTVAASLPGSVWALKSLLALFDLGSCFLLLALSRCWRLPPERTLWYAWNPLVTLEIAGMGHIDGLGVAAVLLTTMLVATRARRVAAPALAAAAAVLAKLMPLVAFPVWARQSRRPLAFLLLAVALSSAALSPIVESTGGLPPGLVRYAVSWEFNGPVYEPLWRALQLLEVDSLVEVGLDRAKMLTGRHDLWNRFYPFNYPQLLAKVVLGLGLVLSLALAWRSADVPTSLRRVFGVVLIFSATVYPWYVLWVLPWAALTRHPGWLALSGLLPLSYLPQFFDMPLFPWVYGLIWLPFLLLGSKRRRWSTD